MTWLYGPLATQTNRPFLDSSSSNESATERIRNTGALSPPLRSSNRADATTTGIRLDSKGNPISKKPILKKRSMSEVMLSRAVSSSNLIKEAAASVAAERHLRAPGTTPTTASYSSRQSPYVSISLDDRRDPRFPSSLVARGYAASSANFSDRLTLFDGGPGKSTATKHIHFSDRVEQCIALEAKDDDDDESGSRSMSTSAALSNTSTDDEDDDGEDEEPGLFLMVRSGSGSFQRPASLEPHTIAKLPATKLKYVPDMDDMPNLKSHSSAVSFSMGDDDGDDEYDGSEDDDEESVDDEYVRYRHGLDDDDGIVSSGVPHQVDGYFSYDPSASEHSFANEQPDSDFLEDVGAPVAVPISRQSSNSNLRGSASGISIASRSSTSNLQAAGASASYSRPKYLEDTSKTHGTFGLESESDSDEEEIYDMDSSLMSSLRRDSVVLARGRIGDPLSPTSPITPTFSTSSKSATVETTTQPPVQGNISAAAVLSKDDDAVERPVSVQSDSSSPTPPVVDSASEHSDEEEDEIPRGLWGQVSHMFSAAKELTGVFMNGGRWKSPEPETSPSPLPPPHSIAAHEGEHGRSSSR